MAQRWTLAEEVEKRRELQKLYITDNLTIAQVGKALGLSETGVYDRLIRLSIPTIREKKKRYNNQNDVVYIPHNHSDDLAEFVGILLGDGHLAPTQVTVTLGTKELSYALYVASLMEKIFWSRPKVTITKRGDRVVYLGSTKLVAWFLEMGLVHNKVLSQVRIPPWCFTRKSFCRAVLRGLLDTDGSVYRLRSGGIQISFCNRSRPLLRGSRAMLVRLGFSPSRVGDKNIYLTRKADILKYTKEIGFSNQKHTQRLQEFSNILGGSYSGNYT